MTPLLGFAPDADPTTPGVLVNCSNIVPTEKGLAGGPSAVAISGLGALAAECRGAAVLQKTDGTRRTFAGTQTRIYELSSGTWAAISGTYSGSTENRWSFAQFGDFAMATNDTDQIQYSTSGTFAAVAGAPKARILVSVPNFVIALNTQDATGSATYGDTPDRWWCTAFQNPTDWAPSVANQCATDRLLSDGGEITAGAPFGAGLVVYKTRQMFLGQYVGPPSVFAFQRVPGEQGCVGPEAVVDIGGAHVFVGEDNIWLYDGSRPVPIAQGQVRQWFLDDISATYRYRTIVTYDRNNNRVWVFYASAASTTGNPDSALVYHLASKKWGRANRSIEAALNYVTPGITWDTLDSFGATWDALPDQPWDSQSWQSSGRSLAIFDTSHNLYTLTGSSASSSIQTGQYGSDGLTSFINKVRLRFFTYPTSATIGGIIASNPAGPSSVASSGTMMSGGQFTIRQSGKWHSFSVSFTGSHELSALGIESTRAGSR